MKRILAAIALVCLVSTSVWAIGQTVFLVKVSGFEGEDSYQVVSTEEYKVLDKRIRDETRYFRKALDSAKKAWKADESHEKVSFPSGAVRPRKLRKAGSYKSREDAQEKLQVYEERLAEAEKKREEKEKERAKRSGGRGRKSKQSQAREKEKAAEEARKEAEKETLRKEAATLFESELEKLMPAAAPKEE